MAAVLYTLCGAFVAITLCLPTCVCTERYACPQVCTCLGRMVDCSKRGLIEIPSDLPFWVEILSLQSNKIRELPESVFRGLGNVTELDLNNNHIVNVNSSIFSYMPALKELKLSYNRLTAMPDIGRNGNLTHLMLAHNKIEQIRKEVIDQLPKLRVLDLNFNRISELRKSTFPSHPSLHHLFLNNNKISVIEKGSLDNLTSLEWLKLNKNKLSGLPKELFSKLSRLRFLELNRNKIKTIDGLMFNGLENLVSLKLKRNGVTDLMDGAFWGLSSIQNLDLDHNNITALKKGWLYGLASLQQLELSANQIGEIEAASWEDCGLLSQLDLTHNNLVSITDETFANLHSLRDLRLNFNRISFIGDDAFTELSAMENLDLSNNDISWTIEDMDGAFTGLVKLKRLGLNSNRIKSISKRAFSGLGQLHKLHLDDNNISSIQSNTFSPLMDLVELTLNSSNLLCDCQLSWLPGWLRESGFQNSVSLICSHPETLKGKTVFEVEPQDFVCSDFPKPVIISEPESQMALKDSNVTLECTAASSSDSPVEFAWKKDNKLMLDADVANTASTNTGEVTKYTTRLHIESIQDDGQGRYQCIISNKLGATYSHKAQITVLVYPTFTKTPDDVTVRAGTTARLECAAMGHPQPVIAWQKNGGDDFPAARERRMHVMPEDDVFFIVNVKSSDQGVYSCTATNDAGTIVANATVNVLETPAFVKKMEDKTSVEGKTTVLECMASGSPKPKLEWHKDGKPLTVTERHFFTAENQLLIIVQTKPSDGGTYTCVMSNTLGTERGTSLLNVISLGHGDEDGNGGLNDDSTTTGIIIIAVVCCVVGTSLIWVIIIYQTRKKSEEYSPTPTDETTLPGEVPTPYHTDKEGSSSPGPRAPPYSTSFPRFGSHGRDTYFNLTPGKAHLAALFLDECDDADHTLALHNGDHFTNSAQDSSISGLHRLQASDSDTIHSSSPSTHSTRSTHSTGVLQTFQPTPSHTPTSAPPPPPRHDAPTVAVVHPGPPGGGQHFVHIVDDGSDPHYGSRPPERTGADSVYENMTFPIVTSTSQLSSSPQPQHPNYAHSLPKDSHGNSIKDRFTWHPSSPSSSSGSYDPGETAALLGSHVHRRPSSSSSLPPPQLSDVADSQRHSLRIHDNPLATDCVELPGEQPPSSSSPRAASLTDAQSQVIPDIGRSAASENNSRPSAQLPHRTVSPSSKV